MSARLEGVAADTPRPGAPLRIELFGELRVEVSGRDVTAQLPGRQGRVLLAYLVLNRSRPVDRDELAHVLWPFRSPAAPEAALSSVLAKVRRALGPDLITGRDALALQLPSDADIDVHDAGEQTERAERALTDQDPASALDAAQAALALLRRSLLPGQQGEWVETWRGHVGDLERRALEAAARAGIELGGQQLAVSERAAHTLIEIQPFREGGYALLMEAQARRGDVAEALRTFERLRVLLREELGARPSPTLMALHGRLLHASPPARPPVRTDAEPSAIPLPAITPTMLDRTFVGREECVKRLRLRWQESRTGQTRLVLLVGEAGVGKTRLAAQFAEEAHAEGGAVCTGGRTRMRFFPTSRSSRRSATCSPTGARPFAGDAEGQHAVLSRLVPDLDPPASSPGAPVLIEDETLRYRLFEAVVALINRAGRRWPLLLVLDDLHWADKPTLLLLRHLLATRSWRTCSSWARSGTWRWDATTRWSTCSPTSGASVAMTV